MSYSPYDIYMDLAGDGGFGSSLNDTSILVDGEGTGTGTGPEIGSDPIATPNDIGSESQGDMSSVDNTTLSPLLRSEISASDISINDTLSLNSGSYQEFGSVLLTLPQGTLTSLFQTRDVADNNNSNNNNNNNNLGNGAVETGDVSDNGSQTIVSSAPSGTYLTMPAPERSNNNNFAISPHPGLITSTVQSISTVCTDSVSYERLLGRTSNESDSESSSLSEFDFSDNNVNNVNVEDDDASTVASLSNISPSDDSSEGHNTNAFLAVGSHLMNESQRHIHGNTAATIRGNHGEGNNVDDDGDGDDDDDQELQMKWFGKMKTEREWETFKNTADMVLSAIDLQLPKLLPVPPVPSQVLQLPNQTRDDEQKDDDDDEVVSYNPKDFLPYNFICPICKDVIVGALTLDCHCGMPTICSPCWEEHITTKSTTANRQTRAKPASSSSSPSLHESRQLASDLDFVWIDLQDVLRQQQEQHDQRQQSCTCPNCERRVTSTVPCTALDVAIVHILKNLSEDSTTAATTSTTTQQQQQQQRLLRRRQVTSMKKSYVHRLDKWRRYVLEENRIRKQQRRDTRDAMLARLIEEEEEMFWNQKSTSALNNTRRTKKTPDSAFILAWKKTFGKRGRRRPGRRQQQELQKQQQQQQLQKQGGHGKVIEFWGVQAVVTLVAATVASVGFGLFSRRH